MAEIFDPYYKWLGIPPKDQPPHHYRLLGIELFEDDRDVIDAAANRVMSYLKDLAVGDEAAHSQKLLNEISRARIVLLNKEKKAAYDKELRARLESQEETIKPPVRKPPPKAAPPAAPPPARSPEPLPPPPAPPELPGPPGPPRPAFPPVITASPRPARHEHATIPVITHDAGSGGLVHTASADQETAESLPARRGRGVVRWVVVLGLLGLLGVGGVFGWKFFQSWETGENRAARERVPVAPPKPIGAPKPRAKPAGGPPILALTLTDEARREVSAFLCDGEAQALPPKDEYQLPAGRHRLVLKRAGYEDVQETVMLVDGVRREFRPRWSPRLAEQLPATPAGVPELPKLDMNTLPVLGADFPRGFGRQVGYWPFDDDLLDKSPTANAGEAVPEATFTDGHAGRALQLTAEQRVTFARPLCAESSELSVAFWAKLDTLPAGDVTWLAGGEVTLQLRNGLATMLVGPPPAASTSPPPAASTSPPPPAVTPSDANPFEDPAAVVDGPSKPAGTAPPDSSESPLEPAQTFAGLDLKPSLATWVHLAFTYSAAARQLHYYRNGETVGVQSYRQAIPVSVKSLALGQVAGSLDELRVFDFRLNGLEVKALAEGTFRTPVVPPLSPNGRIICETWKNPPLGLTTAQIEAFMLQPPDSRDVLAMGLFQVRHPGHEPALTRIRGFLYGPETGEYTLTLQSGGAATLFLQQLAPTEATVRPVVASRDHQPVDSSPMTLQARRGYYFEIWHQHAGGKSALLRLSWRPPLPNVRGPVPIPNAYFSSYDPSP